MSNFHKYTPSQRGRDHLTRSGFDFDDLRQEYARHRVHQQDRQAPPSPQKQSPSFLDRAKDLLLGRQQQDRSRDHMARAIAWPAALIVGLSLLGFEGQSVVAQLPGHPSAETAFSPEPLHLQLGLAEEALPMPKPDPIYKPSPYVPTPLYGQEEKEPEAHSELPTQQDNAGPFVRVTRLTVLSPSKDERDDLLTQLWLASLTGVCVMLTLAHIHQRRRLRLGVLKSKQTIEDENDDAEDEDSSPWEHTLSVATRQGLARSENQDAVWGQQFAPDCSALIVCDGAGGVAGGRDASQQAVRIISAHLTNQFEIKGSFTVDDLTRAIELARETNASTELTGITTALLAVMQSDELIYATLGDGALSLVWPDGMVTHLQALHHTAGQPDNIINAFIGHDCQVPPRIGWQKLEPGCLVMLMSDGASDIFPFEDYALNRMAHQQALDAMPDTYANQFLKHLEEARDEQGAYLHSDNLSLGLMGLKEASHG